MKALDRKLLRDLWRLRTQVLTIALVVASGLGGFVGSLSTHSSLVGLRDRYYDEGRLAHVFAGARRAPDRMAQELRAVPGVSDVETTITGRVLLSLPGVIESMSGEVIALPRSGEPRLNRLHLREGRWPEADDAEGALVSEAFARAHRLAPGDTITALMNGRYERLRIRGIALSPQFVFAAGAGGFSDDEHYAILWIPYERLAAAYDLRGAFTSAALRLAPGASPQATIVAADRILASFGATGAIDRADLPSNRALTQEIEEQKVFGTVLPAVFLGVAIFLLNVLLARHIATERPQIAALKAMGYGDFAIGRHYLGLALAVAVAGIVAGLLVGVVFGRWMTTLYTGYFRFPSADYHLDAWIAITGSAIALAGAALGASAAVLAAVRLPPAEAMRPPAPPGFRRAWIERIAPASTRRPAARMVARELARRPWRTSLTVLGVASSIAIVVGGTWWGDAFDRLVEVELQLRERPDAMITLTAPTEAAALHELARLPGVLALDAARDVPVRLRNGRASWRTAIVGLDSPAGLRRVMTAGFETLPLDDDTLVIPDRLAEVLGLRVGDLVTVEALEGARRTEQLRVAALAGDLLGMLAYATRTTANRLTGERDTITSVRLRLDANERGRFYETVRGVPRFASVGDKTLMVRHFRETTTRNLLVFTGILSLFAACIAVGVVYNGARIALAERSWELATLRVLGFTRGEVSRILLWQVGVPIIVAIPLGCALGYGLAWLLAALIHGPEFTIPAVVLPATYALAILVMLGAAAISGLIVRRRIDDLDLIGVLKTRE